ncbi:MAG TPA: NAD(P)/FAD-dependent oxidoreductase [Eubacteriaceae bacterium]|nr:NAD(P)/FAD-dependent oxidoreductase [Eubacteriaceae bacterium]
MKDKVVIIGGGPSGMIAAGYAASRNKDVHLYEKNERLGKKLFITGKGRCNFTNASDIEIIIENIKRNPYFLYSSLYSFTNTDLINFFSNLGVKSKIERGNRVFPESDKSSDIIKALCRFMEENKANIHLNRNIKNILIDKEKSIKGIILSTGERIKADKVIIATGGLSYPKTGSTGEGLNMVKELGHNIIRPFPSLVPIVVNKSWIRELQGLSLKNVEVALFKKNVLVKKEFGEMIFTHYGISGPTILKLSADMIPPYNQYSISINLKPALTEGQLDLRLQRDFAKNIRRQFKNSLKDLLPSKLIPVIINLSNINENKFVHQITKEERLNLVKLIQNLYFTVDDLRPIEEAIITSGGVDTREINPSTMESKIIKGLFFAGEIIDVDALTGGYNLQIAFSTGYIAGMNC